MLSAILAAADAHPQVRADGPQVRLSAHFADVEWKPAVASMGEAGFVAAWIGHEPGDVEPSAILRTFSPDGTAGAEVLGSRKGHKRLSGLTIGAGSDGTVVVAWVEQTEGEGDLGIEETVWFSIFNRDLRRRAGAVRVSRTTTEVVVSLSVAVLGDGTSMITWSYLGPFGDDRFTPHSFVRVFREDGAAITNELPVNPAVATQDVFVTASAIDEAFLLTWREGSGAAASLRLGRFQRDGVLRRTPVAYGERGAFAPAVAAASDGGFVAVWNADDDRGTGEYIPSVGLRAQAFTADDVPLDAPQYVNAFVPGLQHLHYVVRDGIGGYFVAWTSRFLDRFSSQDGSGGGVFGRRLKSDGTPGGIELQLNTLVQGDQGIAETRLGLAAHGGRIMAAWTDASVDPLPVHGSGVAGRWLTVRRGVGALCADGHAHDLQVTIADALTILRSAMAVDDCHQCLCDSDGSGSVTVADAGLALRRALGLKSPTSCPPCPSALSFAAGHPVLPSATSDVR